jgi:tRNA modification GTPase
MVHLEGVDLADQVVISRQRHCQALASALEALRSAHSGLMQHMPPEIVALDVALATDALGSITGEVANEDVLDAIFREFCVGK